LGHAQDGTLRTPIADRAGRAVMGRRSPASNSAEFRSGWTFYGPQEGGGLPRGENGRYADRETTLKFPIVRLARIGRAGFDQYCRPFPWSVPPS
jgi:hypothetical protein